MVITSYFYYTITLQKIKHNPHRIIINWHERVMEMSQSIFYPATNSPALVAAAETLKSKGYGVVNRPCESVTHLLLPVPSLDTDGSIKGGGDLHALLNALPKNTTVIGGALPALPGHRTIDLLKDPEYLARNAYTTAHCAIRLAMLQLPVTLRGCKVLIVGWGRIGKCLTRLLRALEADLTVAARKDTDRAMAHALGYSAVTLDELDGQLDRYRLIFNTVPSPVLSAAQLADCRSNCLKIDLASAQGLESSDTLWARGLPGKDAPESSGILIAKSAIRLLDRKETT